MAEALDLSSTEDDLRWKPSSRHSRKSGSSNIFSGVNLHQLHKLFRTAGDRNAEHRAKLVWQEMETDVERAEEEKEQEGEDEAGLAQALVGLRVRARNKTGIRTEGHGDHKWLRGPGCLRVEEPLAALSAEDDEANLTPAFELPASDDIQENPNPFKPAPWRMGVRLESTRDSERYLHRILH
ncbi:arginine vasopressin-induced protein 1 [Nothobranchius furzeri]|uniref:Arginine vasopressin-induced protein 1 n=1 Tax=Nothobranchius furzeri TaxID=105023 RepID=A0A1A8VH95_NOTFU|nr:arginine vasopressin-induced protein 1 [Nothobranchius furzeri]XP_015799296.1 arginine vasopressin-induced protein 1 [Nothobranchius furzeri]KAF7218013.1 transcript variant X6 [Nothobranchius furzeri]